MTGTLPKALEVGGIRRPIRSDFRVTLTIFQALNDPELSDQEKAEVTIRSLYKDPERIPRADLREAVEKAFWFMQGGDIKTSEPAPARLIDWEQDEGMIYPAVNRVAGREVRELKYLHWWTFLGLFTEVGDCLLSTVIGIRSKRARGKALDKTEQEFARRYKELIAVHSPEEQAAIDETVRFLETIT